MRNDYLAQVQQHLLLPCPLKEEILAELQDHMEADAYDEQMQEWENPQLLAKQFNATHIPLYRFVYNDRICSLIVIGLFFLLRFVNVEASIVLQHATNKGLVELECFWLLYHIALLGAMWRYHKQVDQVVRKHYLLMAVTAVLFLAILSMLAMHISLSWPLMLLQVGKLVVYGTLAPLVLPYFRQCMQNWWLCLV